MKQTKEIREMTNDLKKWRIKWWILFILALICTTVIGIFGIIAILRTGNMDLSNFSIVEKITCIGSGIVGGTCWLFIFALSKDILNLKILITSKKLEQEEKEELKEK